MVHSYSMDLKTILEATEQLSTQEWRSLAAADQTACFYYRIYHFITMSLVV